MRKEKMKYGAPVMVSILLMPTGYEDAMPYKNAERCTAEVTAVDNSAIVRSGLMLTGK